MEFQSDKKYTCSSDGSAIEGRLCSLPRLKNMVEMRGKSRVETNKDFFTCCEIDAPDFVADDYVVADGGGGNDAVVLSA